MPECRGAAAAHRRAALLASREGLAAEELARVNVRWKRIPWPSGWARLTREALRLDVELDCGSVTQAVGPERIVVAGKAVASCFCFRMPDSFLVASHTGEPRDVDTDRGGVAP